MTSKAQPVGRAGVNAALRSGVLKVAQKSDAKEDNEGPPTLKELKSSEAIEALEVGQQIMDEDGIPVTFRMASSRQAEDGKFFEEFEDVGVIEMMDILGIECEPKKIGCGLYAAMVLYTPALARRLLDSSDESAAFNVGNRNMRIPHAQQLGRTCDSGDWWLTHQGVAFGYHRDEDGKTTVRLRDAQHRLKGIASSETAVIIPTFFGVMQDAVAAIDGGVVRTLLDRLRFAESELSAARAHVVTVRKAAFGPAKQVVKTRDGKILRVPDGDTKPPGAQIFKIDVEEVQRLHEAHKAHFDWAFKKWEDAVFKPDTTSKRTGKGQRLQALERPNIIAAAVTLRASPPKGLGSGERLASYRATLDKFIDALLFRTNKWESVTGNQSAVLDLLRQGLTAGKSKTNWDARVFLLMSRAFDYFLEDDSCSQLKPYEAKTSAGIDGLKYRALPIECLMPTASSASAVDDTKV